MDRAEFLVSLIILMDVLWASPPMGSGTSLQGGLLPLDEASRDHEASLPYSLSLLMSSCYLM